MRRRLPAGRRKPGHGAGSRRAVARAAWRSGGRVRRAAARRAGMSDTHPEAPPRVAVKICGLREAAHVAAAITAGANMVGFVFAPSKRRVTPVEAATLIAGLRAQPGPVPPLTVGLFVNTPPE